MSRIRRSRINNDKSRLCCFGYADYIVLASTLALAISEEVNITDINILSDFFAVLADELALIASVKSCPESSNEDSSFVTPVPDVAMTRSKSKVKKEKKLKKYIKKFKAPNICKYFRCLFLFFENYGFIVSVF